MEDYYQILGVQRTASKDEIKKAYHRLVHIHHPHKGGNEAEFKKINEAYQVLSNDSRRAQYDQFGQTSSGDYQSGGSPFGFDFQQDDFSNIFSDFDLGNLFNFAFRQDVRQKKAVRGEDIHLRIEIDLAEALNDQNKKFNLDKYVVCQRCRGGGGESSSRNKECSACRGKGQVHQIKRTVFGSMTHYSACPECLGFGQIPEKPCNICRGQGRVKQSAMIDIIIPAGVDHGQVLKFAGRGNAGFRGQSSGDLYLEIVIKPHAVFQRQGDDLLSILAISFSQAALGTTAKIKILSDDEIKVDIPRGSESGRIIKIKNAGIPHYKHFGRGNIYLELKINVPKRLSREQERILKELQKEDL